jgi:hypothetical protein
MTPQEFRDAIDDSWPVEIRFMAEQILQAWEDQVVERDRLLGEMSLKMKGGMFARLRAKGWRALTDKADSLVSAEGEDHSSAEIESHEEQARHPEANGESQSRASS